MALSTSSRGATLSPKGELDEGIKASLKAIDAPEFAGQPTLEQPRQRVSSEERTGRSDQGLPQGHSLSEIRRLGHRLGQPWLGADPSTGGRLRPSVGIRRTNSRPAKRRTLASRTIDGTGADPRFLKLSSRTINLQTPPLSSCWTPRSHRHSHRRTGMVAMWLGVYRNGWIIAAIQRVGITRCISTAALQPR